jgi:hypothetical protein
MPDIENTNDVLAEKLAGLNEQFNTNKSFGLMGMLEAQAQQADSGLTTDAAAVGQAAAATSDQPEDRTSDILEPIHSSLRAMHNESAQQLGILRNEIAQLRQAPSPAAQSYEAELDPVARQLSETNNRLNQVQLQSAYDRARNELNMMKVKNPDFDYSENDLQAVWNQHIGNDPNKANATNWGTYFQQQFDSRQNPKLQQRISKLEAELAAKSTNNSLNDLSAVPRGNRQSLAPQAATSGDFDEDVYRQASAKMGRFQFKGFNRALVEAQNKKAFRMSA